MFCINHLTSLHLVIGEKGPSLKAFFFMYQAIMRYEEVMITLNTKTLYSSVCIVSNDTEYILVGHINRAFDQIFALEYSVFWRKFSYYIKREYCIQEKLEHANMYIVCLC